jgi:hypothetical protein
MRAVTSVTAGSPLHLDDLGDDVTRAHLETSVTA